MKTTIQSNNFSAQIKHLGAELFSFQSKLTNSNYIWDGNPKFWAKHSPILFPIVGTLKNNSYIFDGISYQLNRHGFARDMPFELIEQEENKAVFFLKSSSESNKMYPFDFSLQISYTLISNQIEIAYKVVNFSKCNMPFSIGGHPAIALPGNFEDYSLFFEDDEEILEYYLLENDLLSNTKKILKLTDKQLPLHYDLFAKDAMIFKSLQSKSICILKNQKKYVSFDIGKFPNLGIWTKNNAPFVCIEPWFGYSDTTNTSGIILEKEGIQFLNSMQSFEAAFSIQIS